MQKLLLASLCLCLLVAACKKTDDPDRIDDTPVFMVEYDLDSLNTLFPRPIAGIDGIYHFTRYELKNIQNEEAVVSYSAFSKTDCPTGDCPGSIRFEFREEPGVNPFPEGEYDYMIPDSIAAIPDHTIYFTWNDESGHFPEYFFNIFYNNQLITYTFPQQEAVLNLTNNDSIPISLISHGSNNLQSWVIRTIDPNDPTRFPTVDLTAYKEGVNYLLEASGQGIESYQWSNGATGNILLIDSTFFFGEYLVTVTNSQGKTAVAGLGQLPFPPGQAPVKTPRISAQVTSQNDPFQFGKVAIQMVDYQGTIWRSDFQQQNQFSEFRVTENEAYDPNEKGDKVQKLNVSFSCTLFNKQGQTFPFSGTAVVGLAHP